MTQLKSNVFVPLAGLLVVVQLVALPETFQLTVPVGVVVPFPVINAAYVICWPTVGVVGVALK
jgi:hypothetical protein